MDIPNTTPTTANNDPSPNASTFDPMADLPGPPVAAAASASTPAEPQPNQTRPADPTAPKSISLQFQDQTGFSLEFKLKVTTKMKKAMDAFAGRATRERRTLRFMVDGVRVTDEATPELLELEDGDTVDVYTEQIGGCGKALWA